MCEVAEFLRLATTYLLVDMLNKGYAISAL